MLTFGITHYRLLTFGAGHMPTQVLLLHNIDQSKGLVNGSRGTVTRWATPLETATLISNLQVSQESVS